MPQNVKQKLKHALRTYLLCVYIAAIIYMVLIIENYYQKNILENPDAQTWFAIPSILFMGFMIFLLIIFSPLFREFLFRMFGAEKGKTKNSEIVFKVEYSTLMIDRH